MITFPLSSDRAILDRGEQDAGDMTLRRVRVMNDHRVELSGFTERMRAWLKTIGLFFGIMHRLVDVARRQ